MSSSSQPFPSFAELGKECRALFNKGYHLGLFQVNVKNTTCHGMEIMTTGTHKIEDKSAKGEVEINATYPLNGLSTVHKWDTDNLLVNEINLEDLFPGGSIGAELKINGDSLVKGGSVKFRHKHNRFTVDAAFDGGDESNAVVGGSIVTGYKGLMAAYKADFDTSQNSLAANDVTVAYKTKDYCLVLGSQNFQAVNGCYWHAIGREMEVGCMIKVGDAGGADKQQEGGGEGQAAEEGGGGGNTYFGIAGKYVFSGYGHTVRAKVDNKSMLGLGLQLKILQNFSAFASGEVDLKNVSGGNHKIGFGLEFGL